MGCRARNGEQKSNLIQYTTLDVTILQGAIRKRALSDHNTERKILKVPTAAEEPTEPLHPHPPPQQHSLSEQGIHLMHCHDPIDFFDYIYPPHVLQNILEETNIYGLQNNCHQWLEPTYQEIRCFIGLLLWSSLVQLPNRRAYLTTSQIYHLPHFKAHMSCY